MNKIIVKKQVHIRFPIRILQDVSLFDGEGLFFLFENSLFFTIYLEIEILLLMLLLKF